MELIIKGNNNTIEVIRKGKIENIKIFGNNNKIDIQNNSETNVSDQGTGNNVIRNNVHQDNGNPLIRNYHPSPIIQMPRPIQFPIFNFNNINQPIFNFMPNTQNRENEILSKFKESPFFKLSAELKRKNVICSLCTEVFSDGERVKIFSCKKHIFHSNCLKIYIQNNINSLKCPKCNHVFNTSNILSNNNTSINNNNFNNHIDLNINAPFFIPRNPTNNPNNTNHI